MNILITGGAGFIGSNLAHYYLKKNHLVTIFDSLAKDIGAKNILRLKNEFGRSLAFVSQDIRNYDAVINVVKEQDVIFHLAGHTVSQIALNHPRYDFEVNSFGTLNLLEAVRTVNPRAVIFYASSAKVYGPLTAYHKSRFSEAQPLDCASPLACSIGAADQYVHDFSNSHHLKTVVFRLSPVYGEFQWLPEEDDLVGSLITEAIQTQTITLFGRRQVIFDPLYIADVVSAFDLAWMHVDKCAYQVFNLGGGTANAISSAQLVQAVSRILNRKLEIITKPARIGDQSYYVANTDKARKYFSWQPATPLSQGLAQTCEWFVQTLGVTV